LSEHPGLSGTFELVCAAHAKRGTFVARQSFSAPLHLSKTFWDGEILLVNVVNQTAGWFGGDRATMRVKVEAGARVLLSSPSAARFHPSEGREVQLEQNFEIAAGAFLDVYPEISIPQRDSRSMQTTMIDVERGGELLYLETLAPGRVASGESFLFARYAWRNEVRLDGRLVHRERTLLEPGGASLAALQAFYPASYYAGLIIISPASETWQSDFAEAIAALGERSKVQIGASRLCAGGWSIRLLAADALGLRETVARLRTLVYLRLGKPEPATRRM
jgi:urease accessory protein